VDLCKQTNFSSSIFNYKKKKKNLKLFHYKPAFLLKDYQNFLNKSLKNFLVLIWITHPLGNPRHHHEGYPHPTNFASNILSESLDFGCNDFSIKMFFHPWTKVTILDIN